MQPTTKRGRVEFALRGEKGLRELLRQVENRTGDLLTSLHMLDLIDNLQLAKTPSKLEGHVFVRHGDKKLIPNATELYTTEAEYTPLSENLKADIVVLVDTVDKKAIKKVCGFLMRRVGSAGGGFVMGILPCLGYQHNELMFRLPHNADAPKTLHTTMSEDVAQDRVASLGQRFDLARQLAEAVFMLQSANLMHKNIRGDTFLLLQPKQGVPIPPKADITTAVTNRVEESELKDLEKKAEKDPNHGTRRPPSPHPTKEDKNHGRNKDPGNDHMDPNPIGDRGRMRKAKRSIRNVMRSLSRGGSDKKVSKTTEFNDSPSKPGRLEQWLPEDSTVAILTNWSEAKQDGEVSTRSGPLENEWQIKVYRHPSQQPKHTTTAYNFGHDIYSLGVCLLEIGLWDPLHLLSLGGIASVNLLKKSLKDALDKDALEKGGSRAKDGLVLAMKEEAGIAAASRLKRALDDLKVDSNREASLAVAKQLKEKIELVLKEERYHGVSYRLRGALVEIVMEKALKEEGDGSSTLETAKDLRKAVRAAVKDENAKKCVKETANRFKTAAEGVKWDKNVMEKAKEAMDSAVSRVEDEMGVGEEVRRVAKSLEDVVSKAKEKSRDDNSAAGPRIVQEVRSIGEKTRYVATVDELNSLLKEENGGDALRCALVGLANQQLPPTMGVDYTRLVVKCLEVFDNGFGMDIDFKDLSQKEACIKLETQIMAPLRRVNLGE